MYSLSWSGALKYGLSSVGLIWLKSYVVPSHTHVAVLGSGVPQVSAVAGANMPHTRADNSTIVVQLALALGVAVAGVRVIWFIIVMPY